MCWGEQDITGIKIAMNELIFTVSQRRTKAVEQLNVTLEVWMDMVWLAIPGKCICAEIWIIIFPAQKIWFRDAAQGVMKGANGFH